MLADQPITTRHKLSGLWTSLIALFIYGDYFELYVPGKTKELAEGTAILDSPGDLLVAAVLISAPSLLIALTLLLAPAAARISNLVVASILLLIVTLVGATSISAWQAFYVLYAVIEALVLVTILVVAWRWPKA